MGSVVLKLTLSMAMNLNTPEHVDNTLVALTEDDYAQVVTGQHSRYRIVNCKFSKYICTPTWVPR